MDNFKKILLIEDDREIASQIKEYLSKRNYIVEIANTYHGRIIAFKSIL